MGHTVAYIVSRFPHLPETFILREMIELERQGWRVALCPLILQQQAVVHPDAGPWVRRAQRVPFLSISGLAANGAALLRHPARYGTVWGTALWENRTSLNFLVRALAVVPQAVHLARRMRPLGIQHIHAHYASHPALAAWVIHRLTGIPYSVTVHAHDIFVRTAMLGIKLREAAFVAAISEYNREHLARSIGPWVREKTRVVHCGISPAKFMPRPPAGARDGRWEVISVGSLQAYKGHRYLIDACTLLRDRGVPVHCRIVGGGEEFAPLRQLIAERRLEDVVELLGPRPEDEVARLLPTADCYVQPSVVTPSGKMEGIPVALMEALACGLPVVATALSGVPELVRRDETGYLVPPADAGALAAALESVQADPEGAHRRATAGRALVLREFELTANVARLARLFESVIRAPAPGVQAEGRWVEG